MFNSNQAFLWMQKLKSTTRALHQESRPMFNSNQAFLLMQKLKSATRVLHQESSLKYKKKTFQSAPKLLINAELYGLVLAPRLKKRIPSNLGSQFATLGTNVPAFINILMSMFQHLLVTWGQTTSPKCSKLAPSFFSPDSQCKVGLLSCTLQADFFVVQFWGKNFIKINSLLK